MELVPGNHTVLLDGFFGHSWRIILLFKVLQANTVVVVVDHEKEKITFL